MRREFKLLLASKGYIVNDFSHNYLVCDNDKLAYEFSLSLSSLGFKFDKDSFNLVKKLNHNALKFLYFETIDLLKELKGDNVCHIIFYKDFPNMEKYDEFDYYLRALLHYYTSNKDSYGYLGQDIEEELKENLTEVYKLDDLSLISNERGINILFKYFSNLLEGKTIISEANIKLLKLFILEYGFSLKPNNIPMRVNLIKYIHIHLEMVKDKKIGDALEGIDFRFIKTVTDVLRLYAIISDADCSLDGYVYFMSIDRKARRILLELLDRICEDNKYVIDDMAAYEFLWKRALEKLHVGEYKKQFPNIYYVASLIRNGNYRTFNYKVFKAIKDNDEDTLYSLLCSKPGVFARNIDMLLRNDSLDKKRLLNSFKSVSYAISNNVLISLLNFYQNRNHLGSNRSFMYRKNLNYFIYTLAENRNLLDEELINKLIKIIKERLVYNYSNKPTIDKVYLSSDMKNYMLPTNNRNQSSGFKTVGFGSRIKLNSEDKNILRFFTHWKNGDYRVDIDLSLELFDEKYNYVTTVGWHNMAGGKNISTFHSGDIVTAPKGASEFIDLNYIEAKKVARYAVICNSIYSGGDFADINECFSGVMFRSNLGKKGEVFEAKTVQTKFDLRQRGSNLNVALAVDLESLELIWLDIPQAYNTLGLVASECSDISYILKKANQNLISIYDLVMLHKNHINFVSKKEDAKFIIDTNINSDLSPFSLEVISRDWL